MSELIKLDEFFRSILCCPICKQALKMSQHSCHCEGCGTFYPAIGKSYDFRIHYPVYCLSHQLKKWKAIQAAYESFSSELRNHDQLSLYLEEINSVKEIYQEEFNVSGVILDVGGGKGKLRHFLDLQNSVNQYCCIDPFIEAFQQVQFSSNLALAYPCLREPLNFVGGIAERLPFSSKKLDYVHMRSVLDHFYDPYIAMKEAYRVLTPNGKLLIGLSIIWGNSTLNGRTISRLRKKLRDQGLYKTTKGVIYKTFKFISKLREESDHMFHWKYDDLADLIGLTGFKIEKIHWQKPPYDHCVYLLLQK